MIEVGASNRLQQFYQKFNAGKGYYAPAPMARFSLYFQFYPSKTFPMAGMAPEDSFAQAYQSIFTDFTFFAQDITLPEVQTESSSEGFQTILGDLVVNAQYVKPQSNTVTIRVMNTQSPVLETLFYPWLRETTLPYWSYQSQPYTTAKMMIMMRDVDLNYAFTGVRPQRIQSYQPTHQRDVDMTRDVTLVFNSMYMIDRTSATGGALMAGKLKEAEDAEEAAQKERDADRLKQQQLAIEFGEGEAAGGTVKNRLQYSDRASAQQVQNASDVGLSRASNGKGASSSSNAAKI